MLLAATVANFGRLGRHAGSRDLHEWRFLDSPLRHASGRAGQTVGGMSARTRADRYESWRDCSPYVLQPHSARASPPPVSPPDLATSHTLSRSHAEGPGPVLYDPSI